jgi:succinate-semialdehyde dehydrogenase/glutarate-semialdehyde dehydrogenase
MKIQTINPATEQLLAVYDCLNDDATNTKLEAGHNAYLSWKNTPFKKRQGLMLQLAHILENNKEELAHLMSQEMGKPVTAGKAEIDKCSWVCEHYAEHAESYLASRTIETDMKTAKVCYRPLGLVLG